MAAVSVLTFIGTLIIVPIMIVRIPPDYFTHTKRHKVPWGDQHPVIRIILLIGKNILGYLLIGAGLVMLVLPGQGLLTILIGMMLLNFPGKYRLERWLVRRHLILQSMNWLRRRAHRTPLVL